MNNKPDPENTCPYTGHKDLCKEHYINCPKWVQVVGYNPNDGTEVNEWACADTWMPILMVENSQMQRQTGASVDSFRNNVDKIFQLALGRVPGDTPPEPDPKLVKGDS